MPDTKTPISERTAESLVRTIAEWMGMKQAYFKNKDREAMTNFFVSACGGTVHLNPIVRPDHRELVMVYPRMQRFAVSHFIGDDGRHLCGLVDTDSSEPRNTWWGDGDEYGTAFCRAMNSLIEAQEQK